MEIGDTITPIDCLVLPVPAFEGGEPYIVQQGAGMVVTKSTPEKEAAACDFLKWFTQVENNLKFSCSSSYLPVLKEACSTEHLDAALKEVELNMPEKEYSTMEIAFEMIRENKLYTNKAFDGGSAARKVLEYDLSDKAAADREQVRQRLAAGVSLDEAVSDYISEEAFDAWFEEVSLKLQQSIEDSAAAQ